MSLRTASTRAFASHRLIHLACQAPDKAGIGWPRHRALKNPRGQPAASPNTNGLRPLTIPSKARSGKTETSSATRPRRKGRSNSTGPQQAQQEPQQRRRLASKLASSKRSMSSKTTASASSPRRRVRSAKSRQDSGRLPGRQRQHRSLKRLSPR